MSYRDRVSSPGPKKLLALDGGGIRGVITLELLRRLESLLATHLGEFGHPALAAGAGQHRCPHVFSAGGLHA
jgi:hypothetical protein